jgi:hypothetical protein
VTETVDELENEVAAELLAAEGAVDALEDALEDCRWRLDGMRLLIADHFRGLRTIDELRETAA